MLDISAAFDTIDQEKLLRVLEAEFIIEDTALSSYLQERTERVRIVCCASHHILLLCVVPQGSVLGPVMFT